MYTDFPKLPDHIPDIALPLPVKQMGKQSIQIFLKMGGKKAALGQAKGNQLFLSRVGLFVQGKNNVKIALQESGGTMVNTHKIPALPRFLYLHII